MDVTPQSLIDLNRYFSFEFQNGFQQQPKLWDKKAKRVPVKTIEAVYSFRGQLPEMRKWIGDRIVNRLTSYAYSLISDPWESTVDVDRRHIEADQIGLYTDDFRSLGDAGGTWYDKMLTDAQLANGLAYDGQNFYDTDHPVAVGGSLGTFANDFTNRPLIADNLWFLIQTMMNFTDDKGKRMGLFPSILEVPTNLARDAVDAIKQLQYVQRVKNVAGAEYVAAVALVDKGPPLPFPDITPVVNPRLDAADRYYLHSTNRMMPFIIQVRKDPTQAIAFTNPSDPSVFWQRKFIWGIDADGAAGYTLPHLSIRAKTVA